MTPEINDIYLKADQLGTINRAKLYKTHVIQLFEEI